MPSRARVPFAIILKFAFSSELSSYCLHEWYTTCPQVEERNSAGKMKSFAAKVPHRKRVHVCCSPRANKPRKKTTKKKVGKSKRREDQQPSISHQSQAGIIVVKSASNLSRHHRLGDKTIPQVTPSGATSLLLRLVRRLLSLLLALLRLLLGLVGGLLGLALELAAALARLRVLVLAVLAGLGVPLLGVLARLLGLCARVVQVLVRRVARRLVPRPRVVGDDGQGVGEDAQGEGEEGGDEDEEGEAVGVLLAGFGEFVW